MEDYLLKVLSALQFRLNAIALHLELLLCRAPDRLSYGRDESDNV